MATASAGPRSPGDNTVAASPAIWTAEPEECAFLGIINAYRKQNGLGTLTISLTLSAAAEYHAADMAKYNYFGHTLADGSTWDVNIAAFGYPSDSARSENIAAGLPTAEQVFAQWQNSPPHNDHMLSPKYNAIGIGRVQGLTTSRYKWYWSTTFGSRVDVSYRCNDEPTGGGEPRGTKLWITGGGRTSNSTSSTYIYDGKTSTSWYTTNSGIPKAAYVYVDLGVTKSISTIKWLFSRGGYADSFEIQISNDKQTWTRVARRSGARAGAWQVLTLTKQARYIRFYFNNPNKDSVLGYLCEIKVYA
jgi:uncharacterized protein YkwD